MNMRHYPIGNYEVFYIVDNENMVVTIARIFMAEETLKILLPMKRIKTYQIITTT